MGKGLVTTGLDWIDERTAWQFVAILYVGRWVTLAPVVLFSHFVFTQSQQAEASMPEEWSQGSPAALFICLVVISPIMETLVECSLPYWIISRIRNYRTKRPKRCWGFVAVSACVMAMFHPILAAVLPAFVAGAFLAYCYAHFAPSGIWRAILTTAGFHAAINVVGWTILVIS